MDKSVDSIGSCSLDVDADSSDVSETSGSLNFTTPLSAKDFTRVFTSNIRERCEVEKNVEPLNYLSNSHAAPLLETSSTKKPSYLSLACCVNGYSHLTTYDSKMRQEINKSREVSPIRPSTSSIECCKKNSILSVPMLIIPTASTSVSPVSEDLNKKSGNDETSEKHGESKTQSFIQQRVERLYGPSALAQGFYSPKTIKPKFYNDKKPLETEHSKNNNVLHSENINKSNKVGTILPLKAESSETIVNENSNNYIDLPVLRHLSREFRAQLPTISPKKMHISSVLKDAATELISEKETELNKNFQNPMPFPIKICTEDDVDHKTECNNVDNSSALKRLSSDENWSNHSPSQGLVITDLEQQYFEANNKKKDGNYFLLILKEEQNRLLNLAQEAEKYIDDLAEIKEVNEEVLGLLRLASGKARLLVSKKMKQFEGLCYNNLNQTVVDKYPTTNEDLEGFWDMVHLQVDHIDSIFQEIEVYKANNWKKPDIETPAVVLSKATKSPKHRMKAREFVSLRSPAMPSKSLRREAQRKELTELKRKQKIAISLKEETGLNDTEVTSDIFIIENS